MEIHFDLSNFFSFCSDMFGFGKQIFEMLNFDFLGYSLNGWSILIGIAIFFMVVNFVARILQ